MGRASGLALVVGRHVLDFFKALPLSDLLWAALRCPLAVSLCAASLPSVFRSKLWESAFRSGLRLLKSWRTQEGGALEEVDP